MVFVATFRAHNLMKQGVKELTDVATSAARLLSKGTGYVKVHLRASQNFTDQIGKSPKVTGHARPPLTTQLFLQMTCSCTVIDLTPIQIIVQAPAHTS